MYVLKIFKENKCKDEYYTIIQKTESDLFPDWIYLLTGVWIFEWKCKIDLPTINEMDLT